MEKKNTFETEKKPKKSHPTMFDTKPPHRMKERKKKSLRLINAF
jgi:hypothetical protein